MNVKKVLMVLISLALVCSFAGAVSADTEVEYNQSTEDKNILTNESNDYNTGILSYVTLDTSDIKPGFTLSIPNTIELEKNQTDGMYEATAEVVLKNIEYVSEIDINVSVKSTYGYRLSNTTYFIPYTLTAINENGEQIDTITGENKIPEKSDTIKTLGGILKVTSKEVEADNDKIFKTTLDFKTITKPTVNVEYLDILTFTVDAKLSEESQD